MRVDRERSRLLLLRRQGDITRITQPLHLHLPCGEPVAEGRPHDGIPVDRDGLRDLLLLGDHLDLAALDRHTDHLAIGAAVRPVEKPAGQGERFRPGLPGGEDDRYAAVLGQARHRAFARLDPVKEALVVHHAPFALPAVRKHADPPPAIGPEGAMLTSETPGERM